MCQEKHVYLFPFLYELLWNDDLVVTSIWARRQRIVFITFVKLEGEEDYSQSQLHAFQTFFWFKYFQSTRNLGNFLSLLTIRNNLKNCIQTNVFKYILRYYKYFTSMGMPTKGNKPLLCLWLPRTKFAVFGNWNIFTKLHYQHVNPSGHSKLYYKTNNQCVDISNPLYTFKRTSTKLIITN